MQKHNTDLISQLQDKGSLARAAILHMTTLSGSGHPGGSMSSIDILLSLYSRIKFDPQQPLLPDRDRVVISNGHISPAVYTTLAMHGFFELEAVVSQFRKFGSIFEGHVERTVPGIEWSTGNLGQGLSAGAGMAMASRIKAIPYRVWVLMGDGEQQKGQISEARRFAAKFNLSNLCAIIDYNQLQISGSIGDVMPQNIRKNWESDGWQVIETSGHDFAQIIDSLSQAEAMDRPTLILAHTIMGKGVSFMENQAKYHGSTLSEAQLSDALKELDKPNKLKEYRKLRDAFNPAKVAHDTSKFDLKADLISGQPVVYETDNDNRSAWGKAIADLGRINTGAETPIAVIDCDLAASVKTGEFASIEPDKFIQAGIMEHNAAVVGGAMSASGIQTFWSDFGMFGIDEVYNMHRLNDINHTNFKTVVTHVGIDVGEDGKTHQCIDYIGLARNLFGYKLISPADPNQTDRIIRWLIDKPGNYIVTMGRSKLPIIRNEESAVFYDMAYSFEYGKTDLLRVGNHGSVFVTGTPVGRTVKAIDTLRDEGIYLDLYYVSCPLAIDPLVLERATRNGVVISIEDHNVHSGMGSVIADLMVERGLSAKLVKLGVESYPYSGTSDDVYKWAGLDTISLIKKIKTVLA
ncbi:MAG TPA: transketolase [Candidatus Cloacimonadota bacterium]|nr:transketolase [Candidatus Cloacimonadota bacterium]